MRDIPCGIYTYSMQSGIVRVFFGIILFIYCTHDFRIYGSKRRILGITSPSRVCSVSLDRGWVVSPPPCLHSTASSPRLGRQSAQTGMHSFWQRLNAIFFYTLSVLGFLAFAAAGTTYWHTPDPRISLSLKKILLRSEEHTSELQSR